MLPVRKKIIHFNCRTLIINMKRAIILLTAFSFFVSIIGVNVTMGYCPMKKNYSFSFVKQAYSCCCTKSNKKKCCNSEKIIIKKIADNYISSAIKSIPIENNFIFKRHCFLIPKLIDSNEHEIAENYKPPGTVVPIIILHRSILI
jgi:hypothetical protein